MRGAWAWLGAVSLTGVLGPSLACAAADDDDDPLARDRLQALALAQGSASGDARSGPLTLAFTREGCDCPALTVDGETVDLCGLANLGDVTVDVVEGSGVLGLDVAGALLTGAIEADGSFVLAGIEDLSTLGGSLEALRRMDGQFDAALEAEGWAGQRLVGEWVTGDGIDCRWTGRFVGTR